MKTLTIGVEMKAEGTTRERREVQLLLLWNILPK